MFSDIMQKPAQSKGANNALTLCGLLHLEYPSKHILTCLCYIKYFYENLFPQTFP